MDKRVQRWVGEVETLAEEMLPWLEEAYPAEGCGLVVSDGSGAEFWRCDNVIDRYHALDPETYPRDSSDFYMIDPRRFMEAEDRGKEVSIIVHSHPDTGDYFSDADVDAALMPEEDGQEREPIYPSTAYLVVSVKEGEAAAASLFVHQPESGGFSAAASWGVDASGQLEQLGTDGR